MSVVSLVGSASSGPAQSWFVAVVPYVTKSGNDYQPYSYLFVSQSLHVQHCQRINFVFSLSLFLSFSFISSSLFYFWSLRKSCHFYGGIFLNYDISVFVITPLSNLPRSFFVEICWSVFLRGWWMYELVIARSRMSKDPHRIAMFAQFWTVEEWIDIWTGWSSVLCGRGSAVRNDLLNAGYSDSNE